MNKTIKGAAVLLAAMAGTASAGGTPGSIGVGFETSIAAIDTGALNNVTLRISGLSVNYDGGDFHAGGLLGMSDGGDSNDTDLVFGGRFYWHIASAGAADFGVGGSLTYVNVDDRGGGDNAALLFLEPGFQIRAFVVPNVALSFSGGLVIGAADAEGFALTGQATGAAGVHYYF